MPIEAMGATGERQPLSTLTDDPAAFLLHLLTRAPYTDREAADETRWKIYAQRQLLNEARDYINTARLYLEDFPRFQATAEKVRPETLPPALRAFLEGVQ